MPRPTPSPRQRARTRRAADIFLNCAFLSHPLRYFNLSATLEMPNMAQASSLSPPTAPLTPMAPMVSLPALIGTPPATPAVPSILGIGDPKVDPHAFAASPDVFQRDANVSAV